MASIGDPSGAYLAANASGQPSSERLNASPPVHAYSEPRVGKSAEIVQPVAYTLPAGSTATSLIQSWRVPPRKRDVPRSAAAAGAPKRQPNSPAPLANLRFAGRLT